VAIMAPPTPLLLHDNRLAAGRGKTCNTPDSKLEEERYCTTADLQLEKESYCTRPDLQLEEQGSIDRSPVPCCISQLVEI